MVGLLCFTNESRIDDLMLCGETLWSRESHAIDLTFQFIGHCYVIFWYLVLSVMKCYVSVFRIWCCQSRNAMLVFFVSGVVSQEKLC